MSWIWKHIKYLLRNENQGVQVELSVHRPCPLNTYSYVQEENSQIQQENLYKISFSTTTKKTDTTAQVLYTKYIQNTKNYFPPEPKKLTQHHIFCMVL